MSGVHLLVLGNFSGAPTNLSVPVISGTAQEGYTLSTTDGTWAGNVSSYTYQWKRGGSNISGATESSYTLVSGDVGYTITVTVTAINATGSTQATSNATSTILIGPPTNISLPVISGSAVVGQTLTSTTGSWNNSPTSYSYQWLRSGSNISGATSSSYTLVSADSGNTISIKVTATNSSGSGVEYSSSTGTVVTSAVSYRYVKWYITDVKDTTGDVWSAYPQASEFQITLGGSPISMSGTTVTNPGGSNPGGEGVANLVDGNTSTKWLDLNGANTTSTLVFDMGSSKTFNGYRWATANDVESRDPITWTVYGSNDGSNWAYLHSVSNASITSSRNTYTSVYTL